MFAVLSSLGLQDLILKVRKVQFRFVFRFLTTTKELLEIWIYFLLIKSVDEFFFLRREHFNVWVSELFPVLIRRYNFCAYRFLLKVKPRTVCRRNEWVSVTVEFRSWPNFDAMFPGATYCLFRSATEDDKHLSIIFGRRVKIQNFALQKYLMSVIGASWN